MLQLSGDMGSTVAIYGKLPGQADFVRHNAGELARLGFDRWLQEAHEVMSAERTRLPDEPVSFVLAPAGGGGVVVGALAPSQDAVGRSFPLVACTVLDAGPAAASFPVLPTTHAPFLAGACALVARARDLTADSLAAAASELSGRLVPAPALDAAAALGGELLAPLGIALGGLPHGAAYGLRALLAACEQARAPGASTTAPVTLAAPAPNEASRRLWLELCRARLGWRSQLPSFAWTTSGAGRLLVTLGPPTTLLFAFLANPMHRSSRLWPLSTQVDSALDAAVSALTPEQARVLGAPGGTIADVLVCFSGG